MGCGFIPCLPDGWGLFVRMIPFPIIDSHVHLWDPRRLRYPWLDTLPALNRPFLPEDYRAASVAGSVEKVVFVECGLEASAGLDEVGWISELASQEPRLCGIVASVALEKGVSSRADLDALARNPLVKGVRRLLQGEKDADFCLQPDFIAGVKQLADFQFTFDLCIRHDQISAVTELARRCPEVCFVLDHLGKPPVLDGVSESWRKNIPALAALPNVWCKISGLTTEAHWQRWTPSDLQPWLEHALVCFGFGRVMFGGDWPVCTLAGTWQQWLEVVLNVVGSASESEQRQLFHDNAERFYRV